MTAPDGYIEELIASYHNPLYKRCARIVHYHPTYMALIDDCLQETFVKAYFDYDSLVRSGNTYGWLCKCCANYFKSMYRKNKRRSEIVGVHVSCDQYTDIEDPTDSIIRWLDRDAARATLSVLKSTLTPLEASVFSDYYESDMTMKETADHNNISAGSVRAAVERIKTKLKGITFTIFVFMLWCISFGSRTM